MAYPSTITSFTAPQPTDRLNNPSHSSIESAQNTGLTEVMTFVGTLSSTAGSLVYDIRSSNSDGGGHVQSANKGGTGQTSFNKGDVLVAQSSSVISKLSVGSNDQVLVADSTQNTGVKWAAVPAISVSSTIAVSSVWTKPAAATSSSRIYVQLWGGGGSGGRATANSEAGGGGGGGYKEGWFMSYQIPSSVIVNVGAGGASRITGGLPGGVTVFDVMSSTLTAFGGGGGDNNGTNAGGGGGGGLLATGSNGNSGTGGLPGGGTDFASVFGGAGGTDNNSVVAAVYGGGGCGTTLSSPGAPSYAIYGGGGGGPASSSVWGAGSVSRLGGNGGAGSLLGAAVASAMAGSIPGGGGGAAHGAGSSGEGGSGMAIITTYF